MSFIIEWNTAHILQLPSAPGCRSQLKTFARNHATSAKLYCFAVCEEDEHNGSGDCLIYDAQSFRTLPINGVQTDRLVLLLVITLNCDIYLFRNWNSNFENIIPSQIRLENNRYLKQIWHSRSSGNIPQVDYHKTVLQADFISGCM